MRAKVLFISSMTLTALAAFICLRIEIFNAEVGGYLPRKVIDGKWRVAAAEAVRESMERTFRSEADAQGIPYVMTQDQRRRMEEELSRASKNAAFHHFVATWGLLQYLFAPAALLISCLLLAGKGRLPWQRIAGAATAILRLTCIFFMLYRGYASSLGW